MPKRPRALIPVLALVAVLAASCASDTAPSNPAASDPSGVSGGVTVFAAASLTEAFTEIGQAFESANPDLEVTFNFASSSDLVTQVNEGAEADVFASADEANMAKLTDLGANGSGPEVFATNSLAIIVEAGNPAGITSLADLADPGLLYVAAAPDVPIGRYAARVLEAAGVAATPVSLEESVKGIVTKVTLGEADAGIVYRTDVLAAGDQAEGVEIPPDLNIVATYPVATTGSAPNPGGAGAFVDFLLAGEAQAILAGHGFARP